MSSKQNPTVVLVHAAWHHYSCWQYMQAELKKLGYDSVAVDLPSPGSVPPVTSHEADVAAVQKELHKLVSEEGKDVVLLMHSYGGAVGSCSADGYEKRTREAKGLRGGICVAIFCTAFLVPTGRTFFDVLQSLPGVPQVESRSPDSAYIYTDGLEDYMYNDVEQEVADYWIMKLRKHPAATCVSPMRYDVWSHGIPCVYLICDDDAALLPLYQTTMIERIEEYSGVKFKIGHVDAGHSFWLSKPSEAAQFVDKVVSEL